MEKRSNRTIVLEMYKHLIGQCNTALVDMYISDGYIQHSPSVKDGKAGIMEALEMLKKMPRNGNAASPIIRTIEDGDFVAAHLNLVFMGRHLAVIDVFRLQDGKLVEHWDATQEYSGGVDCSITMTGGPTIIEQHEHTVKNKRVAMDFYRELVNKSEAGAARYLDTGYIEHALEDEQVNFLNARVQVQSLEMCRVLAEGNFAVVQSKGIKAGTPIVFYDIFRMEDNKLAEHWDVQQAIPGVMPHANGMI